MVGAALYVMFIMLVKIKGYINYYFFIITNCI